MRGPSGPAIRFIAAVRRLVAAAAAALQPVSSRSCACAIRLTAWAWLLARIDEVFPLVCPICVGAMRSIAFITDAPTVREILVHLGELTAPPRIASARGTPLWEAADVGMGDFDPHAQPAPACAICSSENFDFFIVLSSSSKNR